jgi:hypothetical protein
VEPLIVAGSQWSSTTSLSTVIMAHRLRETFVDELLLDVPQVAEVIWDQRDNRWDTGSRAMLAGLDHGCDYHMVIQDDAVVCRDLVPGVRHMLDRLSERTEPPTPLCLYLGHKYRETDQFGENVSWVRTTLGSGVAVVMPTEFIAEAVAFGNLRTHIDNYDVRLSGWLCHRGIDVWHSWPSLVDHRNSPSLVPKRGMRSRYARNFIGKEVSALDFDPTGSVAELSDRVFHSSIRRSP